MGALTSITTTLVGAGLNAYQSQQQAREDRLKADLAARDMEAAAEAKDEAAAAVHKEGELSLLENTLRGRLERSSLRTGYAASGVKVDSGSAAAVVADKAAWNEYERQKLEYENDLKSWGLATEAADLRRRAASTRASGVGSGQAVSQSLLSSGRSVLDSFLKNF